MPYKANDPCRDKFPDAGGPGGVAPAGNRPPRAVANVFQRGDRDRNDVAPGVRPALAADRGAAARGGPAAELGQRHPGSHTTLSRRSATGALASALATVTGPVQVVIDSTGLKVYGAGEGHREKHGGRDRRTGRQRPLAVDPDSGAMLACDLTDNDEGDPTQVGALLDQVAGDIASGTADGAEDGDPV